jgi:hypothetical protein
MPSTLEIDVWSRWDAVTLLNRLAPCHAHVVQLGAGGERWLVRAATPGMHGEDIVDALELIDEWSEERGLDSVYVCLLSPSLTRADLRSLRRRRAHSHA